MIPWPRSLAFERLRFPHHPVIAKESKLLCKPLRSSHYRATLTSRDVFYRVKGKYCHRCMLAGSHRGTAIGRPQGMRCIFDDNQTMGFSESTYRLQVYGPTVKMDGYHCPSLPVIAAFNLSAVTSPVSGSTSTNTGFAPM